MLRRFKNHINFSFYCLIRFDTFSKAMGHSGGSKLEKQTQSSVLYNLKGGNGEQSCFIYTPIAAAEATALNFICT